MNYKTENTLKNRLTKEPDLVKVEKLLAASIGKQRKEVIGYTLLTLLCTPVFVAIASVMIFFIFIFIFSMYRDYEIFFSASAIYTGHNILLGYMIMFVLKYSNHPEEPHEFDLAWLAGVILFIALLVFTYATNYQQELRTFCGIIYAIVGLVILVLMGSAYMNNPVPEESNTENPALSFLLLVSAFIAMSYGEISRGSWLFFSPKPDEIRVSAWILCRLAMENNWRLNSRNEQRRVLSILARLKLVKMKKNKLRLTSKGRDLVTLGIDF